MTNGSSEQRTVRSSFKNINPEHLYKTEMCILMQETGKCRWGLHCKFAHTKTELRHRPRCAKFKTEPCHNYHDPEKECRFGSKCQYYHDPSERRLPSGKLTQPPAPRSPSPAAKPLEIWQYPEVESLSAEQICRMLFIESSNVNLTTLTSCN